MMKFTITTLLLFSQTIYSQAIAANIGYNYIGKNAGFLGIDYRINSGNEMAKNIGIGTYLTTINKKFTALPEIHYNQIIGKDSGLMGQLSVSTKNVKPSIGFNFLNAIRVDFRL